MNKYFKLLRIHQWIKNLFIFAPIFFSFSFNNMYAISQGFWAFLGFCFISSFIYIINDWKDIEADKNHPTKKTRPLAAGEISKKSALFLCSLLFLLAFAIYIIFVQNKQALYLLILYLILNIAYCFKLKQISIIDISIVAIGFVLRLYTGSYATGISLSYWIIILTFLLALLLVIGKRRSDIILYMETGKIMRKSIAGYNLEFINSLLVIIVSIITFCYIMYTISHEVVLENGEYLYITSLFVLLGLFRYLQAVFVEKKGDSPTKLIIYDKPLQIYVGLWIISFITISIYSRYYAS